MKAGFKSWRESSSLILVAKTSFAPPLTVNDYNYKILCLKRSSKSGFMPNTYVFPGGNLSKADKSRDWLQLYEKFGFKMDTFEKINHKANQPYIVQNEDAQDGIPKYLSLRIGAIRETFEECGVLICRSYKINYKERLARWASNIGGPDIKQWQDRVHNDPEQFLELCREFEVYPDVWALKDWSNWATPASMPTRFDTAFFLASFLQTPAAHAEKHEVQHLEWASPKEYVLRNRKAEMLLPLPQFYEISRLGNFLDIDRLAKFAHYRAFNGMERYHPMHMATEKGTYSILPGDGLYPEEMDPENEEVPYMQTITDCDVQNRVLHKSPFKHQLFIKNYTPKFDHITPRDFEDDDEIAPSKL